MDEQRTLICPACGSGHVNRRWGPEPDRLDGQLSCKCPECDYRWDRGPLHDLQAELETLRNITGQKGEKMAALQCDVHYLSPGETLDLPYVSITGWQVVGGKLKLTVRES